VTSGNLDFQSISISTRSSFSYVGSARLFAQVNCVLVTNTYGALCDNLHPKLANTSILSIMAHNNKSPDLPRRSREIQVTYIQLGG
jgi:hypothetical protein